MAAPHVAGAALLWINKNRIAPTPTGAAKVRHGLAGRWGEPQRSRCGFSDGK